jgi:hypothetical protein
MHTIYRMLIAKRNFNSLNALSINMSHHNDFKPNPSFLLWTWNEACEFLAFSRVFARCVINTGRIATCRKQISIITIKFTKEHRKWRLNKHQRGKIETRQEKHNLQNQWKYMYKKACATYTDQRLQLLSAQTHVKTADSVDTSLDTGGQRLQST